MDLTAIDLTTRSAREMLSDTNIHPLKSKRYNDTISGGSLLFLAAGNDNPQLISAMIDFGVKFDPKLPYTATAPHRAVFDGNLRYLEAFLKACKSDIALLDINTALHFTAAPELFVFSSRRWHRELVDNKLASSLLQFCIVVGNEQAFGMVLSCVHTIPTVVGHWGDALITAAYYDCLWAVKALLSAGADPDYVSGYDCLAAHGQRHICCPLAAGVFQGNTEICLVLLRAGADPTKTRDTDCHPVHTLDVGVWRPTVETPLLSAMSEYVFRHSVEIVRIICWMFQCGATLPDDLYSRKIKEQCGSWILDAWKKYHKPRRDFYPHLLENSVRQDVDDILLVRALAYQHTPAPEFADSGFEQIDEMVNLELLAATLPPRPPSRMGY
jgi:hypothetical protein